MLRIFGNPLVIVGGFTKRRDLKGRFSLLFARRLCCAALQEATRKAICTKRCKIRVFMVIIRSVQDFVDQEQEKSGCNLALHDARCTMLQIMSPSSSLLEKKAPFSIQKFVVTMQESVKGVV
jgi:hypothetical protein